MNNLKVDPKYRNGYKDKARMKAIHQIECSLCRLKNVKQASKTTAHHLHGGGMGKKASDLLCMSLCDNHHQKGPNAFHKIGRVAFEELFDCTQEDLIEITNKLLEYID